MNVHPCTVEETSKLPVALAMIRIAFDIIFWRIVRLGCVIIAA